MSRKKNLTIILLWILVLLPTQKQLLAECLNHMKSYELKNTSDDNDFDLKLSDLADQIVNSMIDGHKNKIAIVEFSSLDGQVTKLGSFLAEELITRLFLTEKFEVIERHLLNKVVKEHKLSLSGIVNPSSAMELGKILGVDAIVSGSITDLGTYLKINARVIATETGKIFSVATVKLKKDDTITKLMGFIRETDNQHIESESIFIKENFSKVNIGNLPDGWVGGDKLMVRTDGRRKYLTDFERKGSHKITLVDINFPKDFELKYTFQFGSDASGTCVFLYLGSVKVTIDVYGWYKMNNSIVDKKVDHRNKVVIVCLKKNSNIFKLSINGEEVLITRYPSFKLPSGFSLEFQNMSNFKLLEIIGKKL